MTTERRRAAGRGRCSKAGPPGASKEVRSCVLPGRREARIVAGDMHRRAAIVLVLALLPGCYLVHERGADVAADAHVPDARPSDGGMRDASAVPPDATPCDPGPEADPDLGPDARPSDYPEARLWQAPPVVPPMAACCTVGAPHVADVRLGVAQPYDHDFTIGFDGTQFALFSQSRVTALDVDGAQLGTTTALVDDPFAEPVRSLRYAEGRWSAVAWLGDPSALHARLFDRAFHPVTSWMPVPNGGEVSVRLTTGNGWASLRQNPDDVGLAPYDECGRRPDTNATPYVLDRFYDAVGLRSRIVEVATNPPHAHGGTRTAVVTVLGPGPDFAVRASVPLASAFSERIAVAALRDVAVVPTVLGVDVGVEVVDPFAARVVGARQSLGTLVYDQAPALGVAGAAITGVAGICWGEESPTGTLLSSVFIDFAIVGLDGAMIGRPVRLASGQSEAHDLYCAVGSDGVGFVVATSTGNGVEVRRVDVMR
jgi:hypothetical protein